MTSISILPTQPLPAHRCSVAVQSLRRVFTLPVLVGALLLPVVSALAAQPGQTQHLASPDRVPQGLAKSDWQSIRAAYEAGRHAVQPVEGGWQAQNPGQQWTTRFDGRGFLAAPQAGGWTWGLELKTYGFGEAQTPVGTTPPAVAAEGQRLTYQWDGAVQEWWVNDQRGLEHGYTVKERPAATQGVGLSKSHEVAPALGKCRSLSLLHPHHPRGPHAENLRGRHRPALPGRQRRYRRDLHRPEGLGCGWQGAPLPL